MKRILLTGCAGFIGSHTLEGLLREGYHVTGIDDFSLSTGENLEAVRDSVPDELWRNFKFHECPIEVFHFGRWAQEWETFDAIIHLAAVGSVPRSIARPGNTFNANVFGTFQILQFMKNGGAKRLVFSSSSSVYGKDGVPLSVYAATKQACESLCEGFANSFGFELTILRYFNVFGPRQNPFGPYAPLIPKWMIEDVLVINGDGKNERAFTYVADVVEANLLAIESNKSGFKCDIGAKESVSLIDIANYIGKPIQYGPARKGDIKNSTASLLKASEFLGWSPQYTVFQGVDKMRELQNAKRN